MWDIKNSDLDEVFIGQWEITRTDDYLTPKCGTGIRSAVVRSQVDLENNCIHLYSILQPKLGNDPIAVDGSVGIMGRITELYQKNPPASMRIEVLYLHCIIPEDILRRMKKSGNGYIVHGTAEFDDIVFNNAEFSIPVSYYLIGDKTKYLWGMEITIPIEKYNLYVRMRDLWYQSYTGCQAITHPVVKPENEK